MSSAAASFVLRRALCRPRFYSSLASRVLAPRALAKACPAISARLVSSLAMTDHEEKVKRADKNLLRVLESKIEAAEDDEDGPTKEVRLPNDFPFEIIDNPGDRSIILKRELPGESIQVIVSMESCIDEDEDEEDDDEEDDERKSGYPLNPTFNLLGTIKKGTGPTFKFCTLIGRGDIHNFSVKRRKDASKKRSDQGRAFAFRDETSQKAFWKYVSARGISSASLYHILFEYMKSKNEREYMIWLRNLKGFVTK